MIPDDEIDLLTDAVHDAMSLATLGKLTEGYTLLLEGTERVQAMAEAGEPWVSDEWVEELLDRWRLACFDYAEAYGPQLR